MGFFSSEKAFFILSLIPSLAKIYHIFLWLIGSKLDIYILSPFSVVSSTTLTGNSTGIFLLNRCVSVVLFCLSNYNPI